MASVRRIIGGHGIDAASRLGLTAETAYDGPRAAFAAAQRWRRTTPSTIRSPPERAAPRCAAPKGWSRSTRASIEPDLLAVFFRSGKSVGRVQGALLVVTVTVLVDVVTDVVVLVTVLLLVGGAVVVGAAEVVGV